MVGKHVFPVEEGCAYWHTNDIIHNKDVVCKGCHPQDQASVGVTLLGCNLVFGVSLAMQLCSNGVQRLTERVNVKAHLGCSVEQVRYFQLALCRPKGKERTREGPETR